MDALREEVDLQVDIITEQTHQIMHLLVMLLKKSGIDVSKRTMNFRRC